MLEIAGGIILAVLFFAFLPIIIGVGVPILLLLVGFIVVGLIVLLFYSYPSAWALLLVPLIIYISHKIYPDADLNERKRKGYED